MTPRQTRVLVVDDSPTARLALRVAFEAEPDIVVVGEASRGTAALRLAHKLHPDLVTMDVYMAGEDGIDVTRQLMTERPTPILVVTAQDPANPQLLYRAMDAGALEVVAKLPSPRSAEYAAKRARLANLVRTLSQVPVVTRRRAKGGPSPARRVTPDPLVGRPSPRMVVVGASTGGPLVVKHLLRSLPAGFPLPVAVVQHMISGFAVGMARWLSQETDREVVLVEGRVEPSPGFVYLAPDDQHLEVTPAGHLVPTDKPKSRYQRPSVDVLFDSAAKHLGSRAIGVLLTGMGRDGAEGLVALKNAGALTIAQSPESCAVGSMPGAAIELGAVDLVLSPDDIIRELVVQSGLEDGASGAIVSRDQSAHWNMVQGGGGTR